MKEIIKAEDIELIYQSAESLSIKKAVKMLFSKDKENILVKFKALDKISFSIEEGKVYGIIGNNGAGKSTLLRILSGVMSPTAGKIERNYKTINLLALGVGFSREISGYDNIFLNGMLLGFSKDEIAKNLHAIVEYSELGDFIYKPMKTYSSGMVSRLGFSIAIHLKPQVLLIDEVLSVGDVKFREKSFNSIRKVISDNDTTVVIVSHSISQIKDLCDRVIWIEKGKLIAAGDTKNILETYTRVNNEIITLEQAKEEIKENIKVDDNTLYADISTYKLVLNNARELTYLNKIYDYSKIFHTGNNSEIKITVRRLPNDDLIIYFEINNSENQKIKIKTDFIRGRNNFDKLYKKPEYSPQYGENKLTGPGSFYDLENGSMLISKVVHYRETEAIYDDGTKSVLKEFKYERNPIKNNPDSIEIEFDRGTEKAAFFIMLSKQKLFRNFDNMKNYMLYHFDNVYKNKLRSSFFQLPDGAYTKLPYSIDPFTRDGYNINITANVNNDIFEFYQSTNERFYYNTIINGILQQYIYNFSDGAFPERHTSTTLRDSTGITPPYVNINLNSLFMLVQSDFFESVGSIPSHDPIPKYLDFLIKMTENKDNIYTMKDGVFFPVFVKENPSALFEAMLLDQLFIARLSLKAFKRYKTEKYKELHDKIINMLTYTKDNWINKETQNLYSKINIKDSKFNFYGESFPKTLLNEMTLYKADYLAVFNSFSENIINNFIQILKNKR